MGLAAASFSLDSLVTPGLRLLEGPRSLLAAGFAWTLAHLPRRAPLVVVDAGQVVDRHLLVEVAGYLGEAPRDLVGRVHLGRAYTPPQLVTLVEAASAHSVIEAGRHALLLVPFDLFVREPCHEAAGLVARLGRALEPLAHHSRATVLVCPDTPSAGPLRAAFVERAAALAAARHRFDGDQPAETDTPRLEGTTRREPA
jgi:hypothetical protein